ncbi:MAG: DUF4199 domain-containing protein [Flavobacteriales bacterium]|nr:DUF4199 domain-containing protein [Flavobacteriales bacterium]
MNDKQFNDYVLQSGLVLGLVFGITIFVTYFLGLEIMVSWWIGLLYLGLAIAAPIYYGVKWRQFKGGYLDFKAAFLMIFSIYVVSSAISTVFNYVLNTVIDPELPEAIFNEVLKTTVGFMENLGTPEAQIDEAIEEMQRKNEPYGIVRVLKEYFYGLGLGAIIALIGGAIIKKNPPVFDQQ